MSQNVRLIWEAKPDGNQVLGNCATSDDLCWKDWPLSVVNQKVIYQQPQVIEKQVPAQGNQANALMASAGATCLFFLVFVYLYSRMAKRVKYLEKSIGKP